MISWRTLEAFDAFLVWQQVFVFVSELNHVSELFVYFVIPKVLSSDELVILLISSLRLSLRAVMPATLPYHELKVI